MKYDLSHNLVLKNLVLMIFITTKAEDAQDIFDLWETHTVAKDYKKPSLHIIEGWMREFLQQ